MWQIITSDDVKTRLAGPELAAYSSAALAAGQADPLPAIIAGVAQEVRNGIAQNAQNRLADGSTVPAGALHHALAMIRYRLISRLPVKITEERRLEYEDALRWLGRKPLVEQPDTEAAEQVNATSMETIQPGNSGASRQDLKGL